ncbi:MAG: tryptophan synthase subunit alpha [Legionellaceae bacterium]|nr:tryptophan synthase subunit alpha [Legionellaceae bacterium]
MIRQAFTANKTAFIPFIMAGYPNLEITKQAIHFLSESGADIIELGVPFSDPVADGPINQKAAETALIEGITILDILKLIQDVRREGCHTPILLFSYLNPILTMGYDIFIKKSKESGVSGVLIIDLPPEEGADFYRQLTKNDLEFALLVSPTTNPKRYSLYKDLAPSFIYYISRLAVTGIQSSISKNLRIEIKKLRGHLPDFNIAVGFGISTSKQALEIASFADGVIVGSAFVRKLNSGNNLDEFKSLVREMASFKLEFVEQD